MRINAADTGLSRYIVRPERFSAQNNGGSPLVSSRYGDSLTLSDIGERLCIQGAAVARWETPLTDAADDEHLQLMDKSISAVGSILEQMKSLTIPAESEALSDWDRLRLQTRMTELQESLKTETRRMSLTLAGKSVEEIDREIKDRDINSILTSKDTIPNDPLSDVLKRALARAEKGEEWDIREKWDVPVPEKPEPDAARLQIDAETILLGSKEVMGGGWLPSNDEKNPTVSERLEEAGTILLMDPKSAKEATERLSADIEALARRRGEFAKLRGEMRGKKLKQPEGDEMDQGRIDAMLGKIAQERLAREAAIAGQNAAAESEEGGGKAPAGAGGDEKEGEGGGASEPLRIETPLGTMEYRQKQDGSKPFGSLGPDPVLVNPEGPVGMFFSRLERMFKDRFSKFFCDSVVRPEDWGLAGGSTEGFIVTA